MIFTTLGLFSLHSVILIHLVDLAHGHQTPVLARLPRPVPRHLGVDGALGAVVHLHVELRKRVGSVDGLGQHHGGPGQHNVWPCGGIFSSVPRPVV